MLLSRLCTLQTATFSQTHQLNSTSAIVSELLCARTSKQPDRQIAEIGRAPVSGFKESNPAFTIPRE